MIHEFDDKTALITGAGSGIGAEIARRLGAGGARVVLADLDKDAAETIAAEIAQKGGAAVAVEQDVADPEAVRRSIEIAIERFGGLELVVNMLRSVDTHLYFDRDGASLACAPLPR